MNIPFWPFNRKQAPIVHPGGGSQIVFLRNFDQPNGRGGFDYRRGVGIGTDSSVVMAPIQWIQRSMPEAPLIVEKEGADGIWEMVSGHELELLIENPNPGYSGLHSCHAGGSTLFL